MFSGFIKKNNVYIKNSDNPICINCDYYKERVQLDPYDNYPTGYKSQCKKFGVINLVTGDVEYENPINCRNNDNMCGISGKYFEKNLTKTN
jgi:hypothetical protein